MATTRSFHRKGGGRRGAIRPCAGVLALLAVLAGCRATSPQGVLVHEDTARLRNPLPLAMPDDSAPLPRDSVVPRDSAVRLASYNPPAAKPPRYESLKLPELKLATDGPMVSMLRPSNKGPWTPDQTVLPYAEFHGDLVKVHNVRNSQYRTVDDYTVHLDNRTYDLRKLTSVDFIMVPFDDNPSIAHIMLSFGFEDKDFLVSSVEIRKRLGQTYSAAAGFFNQYTIMYVLADERDIFWKNAVGFREEVYLYRTLATPKQARDLFVDVMRRVNKLYREPEFYNTVTNNCTTNVRLHINRLWPDRIPYDYRVLLPGYTDHLAYDLGLIDTSRSFAETKARAEANYRVYLNLEAGDFSQRIRRE